MTLCCCSSDHYQSPYLMNQRLGNIYIYIYTYLQPDEDLWISNLHWTLGFPGPRWMHAGGCTPFSCLASRCVSSILSPRVQTPWNLSHACDSPGPRSVDVTDTSPTGLSQGSSNAQSKGLTHSNTLSTRDPKVVVQSAT